jgi:hypothetical protein
MAKLGIFLIGLVASFWSPLVARANPHPLPFTYPSATLPNGLSEIEQYIDVTPVKSFDGVGNTRTAQLGTLVTELEYGLTDRLELGIYLVLSNAPIPGTVDTPLRLDGFKQRLRYRLGDPGVWPVNLGVYAEVAELANELEIEAKVIVDRRLGRWLLAANLWGEREIYYGGRREWVVNPTAGVSFQAVPAVHIGVEYWMRGEFGASVPVGQGFNSAFHHYIGPALLLQGARVWLALAPYIRLDDWGRGGQIGDLFGRFWIRTIIGIEL